MVHRVLSDRVERQRGRSGEWRTHHDNRAKHIGSHQGTPCRHWRAEVVSDHRRHRAITQREDQTQRIAHQVQHAEGCDITVEARVAASGAAIPALVRCHDMEAERRERQHLMTPTEGEFREAMKQQHQRPARIFEAGFEPVHLQAIAVVGGARAHAGWQRQGSECEGHGRHCSRAFGPAPRSALVQRRKVMHCAHGRARRTEGWRRRWRYRCHPAQTGRTSR